MKAVQRQEKLTEVQTELLEEFFDYTEEKDLEVIFVKMPSALDEDGTGGAERSGRICGGERISGAEL